MKRSDFKIGTEFRTEVGYWRCTDIGTRVVVAIKLDLDHDPTWYDGPPYAVVEHVFDEDDLEGCEPVLTGRAYDDRGRARIVSIEPRGRR